MKKDEHAICEADEEIIDNIIEYWTKCIVLWLVTERNIEFPRAQLNPSP